MKATPSKAMTQLIGDVRNAIPFDTPLSRLCDGPCTGCSKKLLEFLDTELEDWELRLRQGDVPTLGDIQRLAKRSRKIYGVLRRNGLVAN
ncbi:MAG: hypothetical protein OQK12_16940 [Motiliproteus sp.]|nr:hypothetical protein [Motiliproteus sp.]MCW9050735.1 hypothetical protein [Motiliproteus sp.]